MESSQFTNSQFRYEAIEPLERQGATCDTFRVKVYGKLHFLKRLKAEHAGDIRYQEALRKEFETGYRLEHPNLVRYISMGDDGILMEYVDGEPLSQRLATQSDYFRKRKNTDKFLRQLLSVLDYLHSHQVLHLDLKPDNILLTRINDDVKLIDLGFCYSDTFQDTSGHTDAFAAPEQLSGSKTDARTDIYAIGKVLEQFPNHYIYNKVIARCTAERPIDRYQSVGEILHDVCHRRKPSSFVVVLVVSVVVVAICIALFTQQSKYTRAKDEKLVDSFAQMKTDTFARPEDRKIVSTSYSKPAQLITLKDESVELNEELGYLVDSAYHSTIASFCDSVFPSPTLSTGQAWTNATTEFHNQIHLIGNLLIEKYPTVPETIINQATEQKFQSLVNYVFNRMRRNGQNRQ